MKFILRLFPEISIKSRPVRNRLTRLVRQNLVNTCAHHGIRVNGFAQWDKVIADFGEETPELRVAAERELSRLPGVHSFLEVKEYSFESLDDLFEKIKDDNLPRVQGHTFAVRVRRRGNHEFTSQQAERIVGGKFKAASGSLVNLDNPDVTIHIEIENNLAYVTGDRKMGMGGFPVGSQGDVFSLISGGFDSGVSSHRVIRRGCRVNYLFFNMGGTAHELGVKQEAYFIWDRYASSHKVRFVTIPFEEIVGQILERTHHGVRGVILKRMMMRVGEQICRRYHAEALVTGESLAQVSSQTLTNLNHIDRVTDTLIIRPCVTMDKQEIIDESREIGTIGFAENMPEFCGVISDHPNVCPKRSFVEEEEAKMDLDMLVENAARAAKCIDIHEIPEDVNRLQTEVETVSELGLNDIVLDVRAPDDAEKAPVDAGSHEVIAMPFYRTAKDFGSLDNTKTYCLFCDQGVMSTMQARQLKELGHHNVKVWRPVSR